MPRATVAAAHARDAALVLTALAQLDGGAQEIALRNATIGMWKIGATVLAVLLLAPGTGLGGG